MCFFRNAREARAASRNPTAAPPATPDAGAVGAPIGAARVTEEAQSTARDLRVRPETPIGGLPNNDTGVRL